uniref:Uncharacterized protein n=1 Tax=Anopheles dirus TaxID=7168 RepID=A0A182NVZ2_9DIPT
REREKKNQRNTSKKSNGNGTTFNGRDAQSNERTTAKVVQIPVIYIRCV